MVKVTEGVEAKKVENHLFIQTDNFLDKRIII